MSEKEDWEQAHASQKADWDAVRELELQLQEGQQLELTPAVRELLRRTARQVAFSTEEAEKGLQSASDAAALLTKIRQRIREGSERVGQAILDAAFVKATGNVQAARRAVERALAAEIVPYYRGLHEALLHHLEGLTH